MSEIPAELTALLGSTLADITAEGLEKLIGVRETDHFEAKGEMWERSVEAMKDVAAFANAAGGLILVGAQEKNTQIVSVTSVEFVKTEDWVNQVLQGVSPYIPTVKIRVIDDVAKPGFGWLLISVQRSPSAPHGRPKNAGFDWPIRRGTSTDYMTVPELRDAFAAQLRRTVATDDTLENLLSLVRFLPAHDKNGEITIDVAATPSFPGNLDISPATVNGTLPWYEDVRTAAPPGGLPNLVQRDVQVSLNRITVGQLQNASDGSDEETTWYRFVSELHTDGDSATRLSVPSFKLDKQGRSELIYEDLLIHLLQVLVLCSAHARRTGAGGDLHVRLEITHPSLEIILARKSDSGLRRTDGSRLLRNVPPIEATIQMLPPLAEDTGRAYIEAGALILDRVANSFGLADCDLVGRNGTIRWENFLATYSMGDRRLSDVGERLNKWASTCGVEVHTSA